MYKLYIILRQDMASMTAGRCAAMASHATSVFDADVARLVINGTDLGAIDAVQKWQDETEYGFGTTIVLAAPDENYLLRILDEVDSYHGPDVVFGNEVIDPEYGILDGSVVHLVPDVRTGIYIFTNDSGADEIGLKELSLL